MITGINWTTTLTKHISWECKCRFYERKCNSGQWWNNYKSWCEYKKRRLCKKGYVWSHVTCSCENAWKNWYVLLSDKISNKTKAFITISRHKTMNSEKFYTNKCIIKMSNKVEDVNMKNRTYYFFTDCINIKRFDPNIIKIDKKSFKKYSYLL